MVLSASSACFWTAEQHQGVIQKPEHHHGHRVVDAVPRQRLGKALDVVEVLCQLGQRWRSRATQRELRKLKY